MILRRWLGWGSALLFAGSQVACAAGSFTPPQTVTRDMARSSPLGASYFLVPMPGDEEALLGRILDQPLEPGRTPEEFSKANPCLDKLTEKTLSPLSNSYEDAEDVSHSAKAKLSLGAFGFGTDASVATHFIYKIETQKRVSRTTTVDYEACCKEKGCGYGFVSALVYGDGEYATGEEIAGAVSADYAVVGSAGGAIKVHKIHSRKIHGYVAALVTITDPSKNADTLSPAGIEKKANVTDEALDDIAAREVSAQKISIGPYMGSWTFGDARGAVTENEFARRYNRVTSSQDLAGLDARRNWFGTLAWTGIFALGAGAMIGSAASLPWYTPGSGALCGELACTMFIVGAGVAAVSGTLAVWSWAEPDGLIQPWADHRLTESDARVLVNQYNRALVRDVVRRIRERSRGGVSTRLEIKGGGLWLSGTF